MAHHSNHIDLSNTFTSECETLLHLVDNLTLAVFVRACDDDHLIYLNQPARTYLQRIDDTHCLHQQQPTSCPICHVSVHEKKHQTDFQSHDKRHWYQSQLSCMTWSDGRQVILETIMDITQYKQKERHLQQAHASAVVDANTDPLLNCLNRRAFFERFKATLALCQRHQSPLTLMMIDVDHFKTINDQHGHHFGDKVLLKTVTVFHQAMRESDLFARYGGDEFILALPNTDEKEALTLIKRIQHDISQVTKQWRHQHALEYSLSFGLTSLKDNDHIDSLLNRADIALYQAKNAGRNRIVCYRAPTDSPD